MTIFSDSRSGKYAGLGKQWERLRSSLDGSRFDTSGTGAHALFGNQHEQIAELLIAVVALVMIPSNPKLQGMFEA